MELSDFGCMLSVGAIHFDRFCASKKGGMGGVGGFQLGVPCTWQLPWLAVEKPWSALASHLVSTNRLRNYFSRLIGAAFSDL